MGQIVSSAEMRKVVDSNLRSYIEQATASYARLFNKSPTFVTYYAQNMVANYADVNLGGAIQLIGSESPIKFTAINDFPLYGISEADASSAFDEIKGVVTDSVRGETYVLPGTIEPTENDFFVIDFLDAKLIFRAVSCNPDRIEGNAFFKITYILDPSNLEDLIKQVDTSYTFELATVGTGQNPLLETDTAILLREMEVLVEKHRESYWKAMYDRSSGTLLMRSSDLPVHDPAVNLFIRRNDLLSTSGYLRSRVVQIPDANDYGVFADCIYPQTVYYAAEEGASPKDAMRRLRINKITPISPISPFFADFALTGYKESLPDGISQVFLGTSEFWAGIDGASVEFSQPLISLAIKCVSESGFSTDLRAAIREFNTLVNNSVLLMDRQLYYWLMPLVLMRAKRFLQQARQNN